MKIQSAIAIYVLFWVMSAFVVMPFGMRTSGEMGAPLIPGQAESAPHEFKPWRIIIRTTIVASLLFALFIANYYEGWVTPQMLNPFKPPQ